MGGLYFAGGFTLGAALMIAHFNVVRAAVNKERARHREELEKVRTQYIGYKEDLEAMQRSADCAGAFKRGKDAGRQDPMTDAERFARTFEGKRVKFANAERRA